MKFYLFVMIALIGVSGCANQTPTGTETSEGPATSPPLTTSPPEFQNPGKVNATPKDALEAFVAAIKARDENAVKASLSEKTNKMFALQTKANGKNLFDLFEPGEFESISELPETRNEVIKGDKATLEAKDPDEDKWDEIPFVRENGSWKLAFADEDYDKNYEELSKKANITAKDKNVNAPETGSDKGSTSNKKPTQ